MFTHDLMRVVIRMIGKYQEIELNRRLNYVYTIVLFISLYYNIVYHLEKRLDCRRRAIVPESKAVSFDLLGGVSALCITSADLYN